MKKFILILFLIIYPINSMAHIGHYSNYNKIEMEIYRNEKLIGYNYYFFSRKDDVTTVTNQIKFSVKILGKTIFQIEGYGEEKYIKDQLISYNSRTLQNEKKDLNRNMIYGHFKVHLNGQIKKLIKIRITKKKIQK